MRGKTKAEYYGKASRRCGPTREGSLVKACLGLLAGRKVFCWRNNTGAFYADKRFVRFGLLGSADIFAVVKGQLWAIECKVGKNPLAPAQHAFGEELTRAGGHYIVVRDSVDTLIEELDGSGT